jgi:hypothetical protein
MLGLAWTPAGFGADAASFAISALRLVCLRRLVDGPDPAPRSPNPSIRRSLAEGWHAFRSHARLWRVIVLWALYGLLVFGPVLPSRPPRSSQRTGWSAWR